MEASEETSEISQRDALMDDGASQSTRINPGGFDVNKFQTLIGNIPNDFEAWASLVTHIEQTYPNDIERIILIYDAFLFEYPLCYGYWNKYANHKARLCSLHEVEETYERAVQAAPYSVDIWVSYSSFGALTYEDPADIRSLYERGLSFVKKDYLCHQLWDKYIEFEYCFKQWIQLAHLYIRTLMFPSKQLQSYYERFKRLVDIWSEEMVCQNDLELQREIIPYDHGMIDIMDSEYAEISNLIKEFVDKKGILSTAAFRKYLRIGEQFYHKSSQLDEKISCFEAKIRRSYFHVKPLDAGQLKNWHCYLDFVERQGDFDWTVKLYERCLIACANYSEFWIRYVEFVDTKGGREIANHALARALTVFLKRVPAFHVYSSMFKEKIGDVSGARALSLQYNIDLAYGFLEAVTREANMEKRMGNIGRAYLVYEKAIELAKESGYLDVVPKLYCNFAQFTFVASGSINAARAVFIKGVQQSPCKLILEGLIHFTAIHGGASEIPILDTIIADAIKPDSKVFQALSPQDREGISRSFLEFVDLHGNIHEIMKAWDRHRKAFPHIMKEECSLNKRGNRYDKATVLPCNGWLNNCSPAPVQQIKQLPTQSCDDTLSEMDVTGSRHMEKSNNGVKVIEEHLNDAKLQEQDVEEHSRPRHVADEQEHGTPDVVQDTKVSLEFPKIENIGEPRHSSDVNVKPPSFDNLSMNSPVTESQQVTSKTSLSPELHEEVITIPSSIEIPDTQHVISTSEVHEPVTVDTKSCTSSQADLQNEESRIYQPTESHATVAQSKFQQQLNAQSNYDLKRDLTASVASPKIASGGSRAQMNLGKKLSENATSSHCHTQMSQPQQWPVHAQVQYSSSGTSSQILMDQSQPHQSQIWPGTQTQQTNQTQLLYQMAAAQAYQTANFAWAGQSMQNQSVVFVQPQPSPQPTSQAQTLGYQQLPLNNEQYGHPQSGQVITPDIWYYYQQQLYYLQQLQQQQQQEQQQQQQQEQQQQNQLMHNVSEQPPQTSQSGEVQQQPEKHSQWLLMQNQQLLIQQQKQENQQSNQEEPQVHASTPEKNQNQPQQQQQASQFHQQSEHANQAQQEQLLYLQQQQQMYLHQQQQLYLQQILQHQFLQQQQQQAPQQQFQQQQTLQQHQQQLLFQQQQLFQAQQMQQEQQQRVGGSEVQVQPTNYIQGEESTSQKVDQPMRSSSSTPQRTPTKQ